MLAELLAVLEEGAGLAEEQEDLGGRGWWLGQFPSL